MDMTYRYHCPTGMEVAKVDTLVTGRILLVSATAIGQRTFACGLSEVGLEDERRVGVGHPEAFCHRRNQQSFVLTLVWLIEERRRSDGKMTSVA